MQHNKMCFITCLNDEVLYDESVRYINSLHVPDDFEVEIIAIRDAKSLTEGYNRAMRMSDAKYKVYLHQDTLIINKTFINDVVSMFTKYPKLGMMGVIGAEKLPPSGTWWKANVKYGKVFESSREGRLKIFENNEVSGDYQPVEAVDGLILMTQYDINWRDDLFKGWHMYDISQAMEFKKAGYDIGVPRQEDCWCLHDCGPLNLDGYEVQRTIFVQEYSNALNFPLVSILIPTYNRPEYFREALESALNQTYKNIEIVVCDDSINDLTQRLIEPYLLKYPAIRYYKNPQNIGAVKNVWQCFEYSKGEYINFLMDDDLLQSTKIEKMMSYFLADQSNEISLVTSYRKIIDSNGKQMGDKKYSIQLFKEDTVIDGVLFGEFLLNHLTNYVGEPTTPLFKKSDLKEPFGVSRGRAYGCSNDFATWMELLRIGKIVYISEALSFLRFHEGQQSQSNQMFLYGSTDFAHQVISARENGFFITKDLEYLEAIQKCIHLLESIFSRSDKFKEFNKSYTEALEYLEKLYSLKLDLFQKI